MIGDPELILERAAEKLANGEYESALKSFEFLKQVHRDFQPDWYWDSMIGRCLVAQMKDAEAMPYLTAAYKETDEDTGPDYKASLLIDLTVVSFGQGSFEQGRNYAREGEPYVLDLDRFTYRSDRYVFFLHYGRICVHLSDYEKAARLFSLALADKQALNKEEEAGKISLLHLELFRVHSFVNDWKNAQAYKERIQYDLLDLDDKRNWHYVMLYYLSRHNRSKELLHIFEQYRKIGIDDEYLGEALYYAAAAHFELKNRVMARKLMLEAIDAGLSPGYREYAEQFVKVLDEG